MIAAKSPSAASRAHSERVDTHVVASCLDIHMSLNEGLLSLRVDLEDTLEGSFLLRRFWIAAKSPSAAFSAHSERVLYLGDSESQLSP